MLFRFRTQVGQEFLVQGLTGFFFSQSAFQHPGLQIIRAPPAPSQHAVGKAKLG